MEYLSKKLVDYVINVGAVPEESYAVYQYGFQIGLEMILSFGVCFWMAIYLHMIPEFVVFTGIFMLLRTYAGGVHLNSFGACLTCSATVQTLIFLINNKFKFTTINAWVIILASAILIAKAAPVENINKELDSDEKIHCKKVTIKNLVGILIFAGCCTAGNRNNTVSLIAMTVLVVLISQYVGMIKFKIEKSKNERR